MVQHMQEKPSEGVVKVILIGWFLKFPIDSDWSKGPLGVTFVDPKQIMRIQLHLAVIAFVVMSDVIC